MQVLKTRYSKPFRLPVCKAINHGERDAAGVDSESCLVRKLYFLLNALTFLFFSICSSNSEKYPPVLIWIRLFELWVGGYTHLCVCGQRENRKCSVTLKCEVN